MILFILFILLFCFEMSSVKLKESDKSLDSEKTIDETEENSEKETIEPLEKTVDKMEKKRLVILDINGLLCYKIKTNLLFQDIKKYPKGQYPYQYYKINNSIHIIFRPYYYEFLVKLFENYHVAFFSSTTEQNASKILNVLLTKNQMRYKIFSWYRDHTKFDPDKNDKDNFETIKLLEDVYTNPVVNINHTWSNLNTIMVDDSVEKTRFNDSKNIIIVPSFIAANEEQVLLQTLDRIKLAFENLENNK